MSGPQRIGVLGGTFDPVHLGHLAMARAARDQLRLEPVLLVPAVVPPHKQGEITPYPHRLAMVRRAVEGEAGIEASDLEGRRGGVSYTVETLEELARERPGARLFFIIGEDSIAELRTWKNLPRIFALAQVAAVNRPGHRRRFAPEILPGIPAEALARCEAERVEMAPVPIASREIRALIRAGKPYEHLLPPGVGDYIRRHRLYGAPPAGPKIQREGENP